MSAQLHMTIRKTQRGVALFVSLIILLVMTLLGVVAMNTSVLELLMSANTQFQMTALSAAEQSVRTGEIAVQAIVDDGPGTEFSTAGNQYHDATTASGSAQINPASLDWSGFTHATVGSGQYVVQYGGKELIPGESIKLGSSTAGSFVHVFVVSGRNASSKGAVRIAQTVYVTNASP